MRKRNDNKEFFRIKKKIRELEPDINKILSSKMLDSDKIELYELVNVYKQEDSLSVYKLELKKSINKRYEEAISKYKKYKEYTEDDHKKYIEKEKQLVEYNSVENIKYDILKLQTSEKNRKVIYNEYIRLCKMSVLDDEVLKIKNWLKWALLIPHDKMQKYNYREGEIKNILKEVSIKMDNELYGMKKVKEQILLFLNSRLMNPDMKKCSLGLLGPPGCGKTTIVRLLAKVLNYPLEQISLGGTNSSEFLKGHQYTYVGSEPGEIVKCLARMSVKNGIMFFDEYDKITKNKDVCSALLHITDNSQNSDFQDNFLSGITIDLSHLWFFYSMNKKPTDAALNDRIFYIDVEDYSQYDKVSIVKEFLTKRACKNIGWKEENIIISDRAAEYLVEKISPKTIHGIRSLENSIIDIVNKINFLYNYQDKYGKVNDFDVMFKLKRKVQLPFTIEKEDIDILI